MTCLEWSQSSWGLPVCEAEAIKAFRNLTGKTIYETRIWLDSSEILGSSSDGIPDSAALLFGKPGIHRQGNMTIEEAVNTSLSSVWRKRRLPVPWKRGMSTGRCKGKFIFLHRQFCSFMWTTKDIVVLKITRDDTWAENFRKLTLFYLMHPFPKVVEG